MDKLNKQIEEVTDLIRSAKKVLVFTGAGVSTESGIPDFRGADGIWSKYDPEDFTIQKFLSDKNARKMHWNLLTDGDLSMFKAAAQPCPPRHHRTDKNGQAIWGRNPERRWAAPESRSSRGNGIPASRRPESCQMP